MRPKGSVWHDGAYSWTVINGQRIFLKDYLWAIEYFVLPLLKWQVFQQTSMSGVGGVGTPCCHHPTSHQQPITWPLVATFPTLPSLPCPPHLFLPWQLRRALLPSYPSVASHPPVDKASAWSSPAYRCDAVPCHPMPRALAPPPSFCPSKALGCFSSQFPLAAPVVGTQNSTCLADSSRFTSLCDALEASLFFLPRAPQTGMLPNCSGQACFNVPLPC